MSALEELLAVLRDAQLAGDRAAVAVLHADLAEQLGVSAWGSDLYGLWMGLDVGPTRYTMRWIEPGSYTMGSPLGETGRGKREDQHAVTLLRGLWLGESPVTWALRDALNERESDRSPDRPVTGVDWRACTALGERLRKRFPSLLVRLPRESEWEFAARAGTSAPTYAQPLDDIAWYAGNSGAEESAPPVKRKRPNDWGLYDMLGNVWEWCQDRPEHDVTMRVARGGSWRKGPHFCRAASKILLPPEHLSDDIGFRLAAEPLVG